jgi:hypothetical protein
MGPENKVHTRKIQPKYTLAQMRFLWRPPEKGVTCAFLWRPPEKVQIAIIL